MRKFTAILGAIVLALIFAGVLLGVKKAIPWENLPFARTIAEKLKGDQPHPIILQEPETENLSYEEHLAKGDHYFEGGFYTLASNQYVRATHLEPRRAEPYVRLMRAQIGLAEYERAKGSAEVALAIDPAHAEARFLMALAQIKQSDFGNARATLAAFSDEAATPDVRYYRAMLAMLEDSASGETLLRDLRATNKDPVMNQKIDALLRGYDEFKLAKAAEPLYLDELLARGLNQAEEYAMAIHKLKGVLKERLDLRDAWVMLGFAYLNLQKYYFALTAFQEAYELDSEMPATQYFLGLTYQELGQKDEAALYLKNAIDSGFEPLIVAKQKLADLYFDHGSYDQAAALYQEILEINQRDLNAYVRPIWLYIDFLQKPEEAHTLARTAAQLFPNQAMSYNLLGWSEAATGQYPSAEANLKKAIELNPNLAAAYYNLGKLYESTQRHPEALSMYQKAYEADRNGSIGNLAAKRYNGLL